ncbi:fatty acid synthase alpha subunit Lsd1 [Coemansia sp. Benny D115]|nr:fatty acid synthase alpha subunit Lsd1 [Coemansia sp. Benny D115]
MVTKHYVGNQYVASLESRFLSREHYADSNSTFKDIRQQRFLVALQTVEDISILESRAWFVYLDDVQVRPSIDSQLEFCLDSLYRYGDDGSYSSISTKGSVKLVMPRGQSVHVANVCFECGNAASDPVIGYLGRHAIDDPHSKALLFEDGGYLIALQAPESQRVVRVPSSNHEYAKLSRDYNPIHTNDYIADMVGLPMPITHGLWTSASTRAIVENLAAADEPARIRMYQTYFVGMVLPGSRLKTELWHVGMINGQMMIKGQTTDVASGSVVLECEARIEQPKTAYVFTGQGSQEVGMGMKLYRESVAARTVWDRAEKHMLAKYGVSLLEIVRNNSQKLTVYFSGRKGEQIRQNYMHLKSFDLTQSKSASILPDLCEEHEQFTFYSSTGLLHSTQFTQVLLFTLAVATIADMKSYGVFQVGATFAGHSLGEYAALVAMCEIFKFEDIIDVVFYRGLVMQSAVKRDKHGRSQYGMVAINPSHVGKWFDEAALTLVVASIVKQQSELLEVVNYNVRGQQYVASGTLVQLAVLRSVLDTIAAQYRPTSSDSDLEAYIEETVKAAISSNIDTVPQRGIASIPLEGIDVPFHSSQLSSGTVSFRRVLTENACISSADYAKLKGRFIPNLTAVPFEVSKEYFELVHRITASDVVDSVLKNWCDDVIQDSSSTEFLRLAKILLVELMAHQISMPVQWINTQDQLFGSIGVCRIIEVGPRPILCGMAAKTLSSGLGISQAKSVSLLHIERDKDTIYYTRRESYEICSALSDTTTESRTNLDNRPRSTEKPTTPQSSAETDTAISNATVAIEAAAAVTSAAAAPATSAAAAPASVEAAESELIADVPLAAIDVLRAIVAHKSKRKFQDVLASTSIKSLVAGKSTLQNEIVGDLHKEFGSKVPDKVEELPLHEVAAAIGTLSGDGGGLGKHTQSLLSRLFSNKMPGGLSISSVRNVLQSSYGLGPRRQDALLLVAVTMDPPERLANSQSAMAWLATVAKEYASAAGITYAAAASTASAGGSAGAKGMVISGAALDAIQKKERECAMQQIEVLARYLGLDLRKGSRAADQHKETAAKHQSRLDAIYDELGEDLVDGVQPYFDTRKVRRFDSYWNWIRQDAFEAIQRAIIGKASCNGSGSHKDGTTEFMQRLRNCADLKMVKMLSGIESILEKDISDALQPALQLTRAMRTACTEALDQPQVYIELSAPTRPQTIVSPDGTVKYAEVLREDEGSFADFVAHMQQPCQVKRVTLGGPEDAAAATNIPLINMRKQFTNGVSGDIQQQECDPELSKIYFDSLHAMCTGGISFAGRVALVTGCGKGSIGAEIVRSLLAGGARVIATTSNFNRKTTLYFEELYRACGSRDTELVLVSFNQCSTRDVSRLIDYIYSSPTDSKGLGWDLDFIFPFAAIGDVGSTVSNLGSRSELAQRAMLTNTLRLVGAVKTAKELHTRSAKPAVVVLPLSPNRGVFGGDGLYSECKLGLESAFNRWHSESWGDCLSVIGASIGWTRGTTIMSANNLVAQSIEELGVRTFSAREMAFSILHGMVDLDKVVVITGFGELGPFGSARTRWEIEAHGEFSIEGCIELAWVMGLIKHHDGKLPESDKHYVGWVDAKTGKPVRDIDVKPQYEDHILAHTGIRLIEPELSLGYDPNKKQVLRDIQIEHDMEPFETSEDAASSFKRDNGDKVDVWEIENGGGSWNVRFLKGALIRVPASAAATRLVSAQLPTGWSPALYGIPDDVISQVDPFTQYALVATVEALICSGITDPYELFRYLHVSEIGNSTGSGIGGMKSVQDVFCKRHLDEDLSNDVIQEVFISTVQAWINMLLISASGPVKPVVGACATAAVSIDVAVDTIQAGKARFMIAGGAEDLSEESSTEFSNMGASSNSVEEAARGRAPAEMSRPCTSTRSGFIEGQGASIVTLMSAAAAIEMGAPIYGIVALASTATDKQGSSVPAPGQGILTSAREAKSKHGLTPRILHLAHRREQFARQKAALDEWKSAELKELATQRSGDDSKTLQEFDKQAVEDEYKMQLRGLQDVWGSGFWKRNVSISPLRGSLAVWGLCADDVGMASFHGTSTLANDRNESDVLQSKLDHLGRTPGHVLPVVCQKWLTGHSKGAAAGFMLNGVLQCMQEGLIPGNRNADNISEELRQFDGILYPSKTIQTAGIKAAMLTSFGFGQVGGELLIVHPDYLLAALDASQLEEYACKAARREQKASRYWQDALVGRHSFVQVKNKPPYTEKQEKDVYLNPLARAVYDAKSGEYRFQTK